MQILLALIFGAVVGLAAHFVLPHREVRGVALAPVTGAAAAGVSWTLLTWVGIGFDSPVPWIVSIVAPAVATLVLLPIVSRVRLHADADLRARSGI
ncbi:MAG: hypothetical protein BGO45_11165 [Microbacterium sp. 71-36]|uniref:hypothetical protein n=1 Tax=unclassified Microbacterium TaxID=2609290 RepID=UPI0008698047|nr:MULTISPECIES: hypothetical protein [unclassified Microbacterium]MBN9211526.1 hypothetical protein [Microbacterium sp.]ODT40842.1 MAG: hypothetical protein ABS60_03465 [Microbacterium sp. SCN 71-17]OJV77335.1 MAG: hypothetical protein BGO45_11165 [Microbacterium sp. 71-36]